eukprot:6201092-Pleurochrysis_carterae.AAC.2
MAHPVEIVTARARSTLRPLCALHPSAALLGRARLIWNYYGESCGDGYGTCALHPSVALLDPSALAAPPFDTVSPPFGLTF